MHSVRTLSELTDVSDPAWPELRGSLDRAEVDVDVLPVAAEAGRRTLYRLQVTARSTLGALALHTGGVRVDHGWLTILGGGHADLPDIATASGLGEPEPGGAPPGSLVVALDVFGGRFAVNGGGLPGRPGEVCYFAPDRLDWLALGAGHSAFVGWALGGGLADFAADRRWPGWQDEVGRLEPGRGLSVYPPLWSAESRAGIAAASRKPVPLAELTALQEDAARQLSGLPDGAQTDLA